MPAKLTIALLRCFSLLCLWLCGTLVLAQSGTVDGDKADNTLSVPGIAGCSFDNPNQESHESAISTEEDRDYGDDATYQVEFNIPLDPSDPNYADCMRVAVQYTIATGDCLFKSTILYDTNNQPYAVERTMIDGWTNRVVQCIENKIDEVTYFINGKFTFAISGIVGAVLVLYTVLFFIRIILNPGNNLFTDGMVMLLTLLFVAVFSIGVGSNKAYDVFKTFQNDLIEAVTDSVQLRQLRGKIVEDENGNMVMDDTGEAVREPITCTVDKNGNPMNLWRRIDCITVFMFGMRTGLTYQDQDQIGSLEKALDQEENTPFNFTTGDLENGLDNKKVSNILLMLLSGSIFSATGPGYLLFITGGFVIVGLLAAIFQCVIVYLAARIYIAFMSIIFPAIVTCLLFQNTKKIFTYSLSIIVAGILQPAILFGYMAFMLNIYHFAMEGDAGILNHMQSLQAILESDEADKFFETIGTLEVGTVNSDVDVGYDGAGNITAKDGGGAIAMAQNMFTKGFTVFSSAIFKDNEAAEDAIGKTTLQGFIVMIAVLLITFAFMENVLSFGAQIAGVGMSAEYNVMNIHQQAKNRMTKAAKKYSTTGKFFGG